MPIQFNGNVTINGNVEVYENGSMKITANQINVNINNLSDFIQENLKYSPAKIEYLDAAETLQNSNKVALHKLGEMAKEIGKNVMFTGLSQVVISVIKGVIG